MSEPEGFLARWTRRKREAKGAGAEPETAAPTATDQTSEQDDLPRTLGATETAAVGSAPPVPEFDVASLPPIGSITAASDVRAFLVPGVPVELTRAALRRAWSADPAIRDFVGIAENQWDFTAPNEILGFGPLESGEEVRRLVAEVFGDTPPAHETETADHQVSAESGGRKLPEVPAGDPSLPQVAEADPDTKGIVQRNENISAPQYSEEPVEDVDSALPRGHGRALPR